MMAAVKGVSVLKQIWRAIPLKLVLLLTAAGLAMGEWYPLSHYPMYSHFEGQEYYVFLADGEGQPVPCKDFGLTAPKLKKRFKGELKEAGLKESDLREGKLAPEDIGGIASKVLERVAEARRDYARISPGQELTMSLVHVFSEDGEIKKRSYRVAGTVLK